MRIQSPPQTQLRADRSPPKTAVQAQRDLAARIRELTRAEIGAATAAVATDLPPTRWMATPAASSAAGDRLLLMRPVGPNGVQIYSCSLTPNAAFPLIFADVVLAGAGGAAVAVSEEMIWRQFWKLVGEWLAKRGAVMGGLALADGPLPIGEILAIGVGIWTIYELYEHWDELWAAARRLAQAAADAAAAAGSALAGAVAGETVVEMSQTSKRQIAGQIESLILHLTRLLNAEFCHRQPDHQEGRTSGTENHWWDEIRDYLNNIIGEGKTIAQLRKLLLDTFGEEKMRQIVEELVRLAELYGQEIPDILSRIFPEFVP